MNRPSLGTLHMATFVFLALVWGSSFVLIRVLANAGVEAFGVAAGRCLLGFISLIPFAYATRAKFPRDRRTLAIIAGLGVLNFATPWTLFALGAQHVPSGVSSITNASTPLWAAVFSTIIIRDERLSGLRIVGLAMGFVGVLVLMESRVTSLDREALLGIPVMLVATAAYGLSVALIRRWLHHVHPIPLTFGQVGVAALLLVPLAAGTGAWADAEVHWQEIASILFLGGVGSGVASVMYMWLIGSAGPVRAASTTYLMPPVGVLLGWVFLEESVAWSMLLGVGLILAGVATVRGRIRFFSRVRPAPPPQPVVADP